MDVAGTGELDGMEDLEEAENIGNGQNVQDELSPGNGTLQEETPSEEIPSEETPPDGLQSETLVQGESTSEMEPVITDSSYESSSFSISITTMCEHDTQIYIADVTVSDVSCLRTGLAGGVFGRNRSEERRVGKECRL